MLGGTQVAALTASPDQDHLLNPGKHCAEQYVFSNGPQARDAHGVRARALGSPAVDGELPPMTRTLTTVEKRFHLVQEVSIRVELALEDLRRTDAYAQTAPGAEVADLRSRIEGDCFLRADFYTSSACALSEPGLLTQPGRHRNS